MNQMELIERINEDWLNFRDEPLFVGIDGNWAIKNQDPYTGDTFTYIPETSEEWSDVIESAILQLAEWRSM